MTHIHVAGASHHLHIDPESAPQVAEHIHIFLCVTEVASESLDEEMSVHKKTCQGLDDSAPLSAN